MTSQPSSDDSSALSVTPALAPSRAIHEGRWRSRIVAHGDASPADLVAHPLNPRRHPKMQADALSAVLGDRGWLSDVVVNRTTGHILDGHLRVELALARGELSVPVTYVEIAEDEEPLVLATFDPIGALATTDKAALDALLHEVSTEDPTITQLLETVAQESGLSFAQAGLTDPDELPPEPAEADVYVRRGDLWILGDHRILCGDATQPEDVARLLGGNRPAVTVTDPPYGVDYDPKWRNEVLGKANRRLGQFTGDGRADWREAWALSPSDVLYVWHGALHSAVVAVGLEASGFEIRSQIIWVKPQLVISRGAYHWRHETCWYAVRVGATANWIGDRKQDTVWEIDHILHRGDATGEDPWTEHGTQKPVEVMARPLRNHRGDVYDPFVGSGTTIIAAETLGRRCYAMEIEPKYVQIAIERWSRHTGREAVRAQ